VERFSRRDVSAALGRRSRERGLNLELRGRLPLVRVVPPGRVRRRAPVLAHRARVHPITIPEGLCRDPRWEHRPSGRTRSCVGNPEPPSTPAGTAPGDAGIASAVQRPQLSRGHSERSFVTVIRVRPCRTGSVGRHGQIRTRVREWRRSPFGSTMLCSVAVPAPSGVGLRVRRGGGMTRNHAGGRLVCREIDLSPAVASCSTGR
jgi:hypothetical protein